MHDVVAELAEWALAEVLGDLGSEGQKLLALERGKRRRFCDNVEYKWANDGTMILTTRRFATLCPILRFLPVLRLP
jgi:hypothetical protein